MDKPKERRGFKRKVLMVVGALSTIAVSAFAAILISALMTGSLTTIAKPTLSFSGTPTVERTDGSGIVCTPTINNGKLNVDITKAMPGSSCTVVAQVSPSVDGLKVQGVSFGDLQSTFVSGHLTHVSCGFDLKASTQQRAYIKLTVPQNAPIGTSAISGELTAVPAAQYDAALCSN